MSSGLRQRRIVEEFSVSFLDVICCGFGLEDNVGFAHAASLDDNALGWFEGPIVAFDANRFFSRPTLAVVDGAKRLQ